MKRFIKLLTCFSILLVFIGSGLAGILSPVLASQAARAAPTNNLTGGPSTDPEYALFYPSDKKSVSDLVAAARDGGIGNTDANGVLSKTYVISKGGPLGTFTLPLSSQHSAQQNILIYTRDYYCSPTESPAFTLSKPDDTVPYIRYTYGISLMKENDFKGLTKDKDYRTQVGMYGNDNVGTVHFPEQVNTDTGTKPAQDWDLPGKGGDNNIRSDVDMRMYNDKHQGERYLFDQYDPSLPGYGQEEQVFNLCKPTPNKYVANKAINLQLAPDAVKAAWTQARQDAGIDETGASAADTTTNDSTPSLSCHAGFNPLNWLICGVVEGMVGIIGVLDDAINSQLSVGNSGSSDQPNQIFADSSGKCGKGGACDSYYRAWKSFRNIALGLMIITGLVVLLSQALGLELLDAYTIRKVLPRLLIAALGITLSWQLMEFFVTLTNDLGYGVRRLIYAPFIGLDTSIHLNVLQSGVGVLGTIGAAALGVFGLAALAGAGALAVLIAFMVLILRQIAIIMLIILSPIAIVAYILPNTQKVYKLWWESFSKALLMFPLIAGFIAAGRVFSAIALTQSDSILSQLIGFFAYFAPYFLIPLTFKFAGGALRNIGGFVNDRGTGGFGFLRKKRQENTGKRVQRARAGKLWNENFGQFGKKDPVTGKRKSVGRIGSRLAELGLDPDEQMPFALGRLGVPGTRGYYAKTRNRLDSAALDQTQKITQEMEKSGLTKQAYRALVGSYGGLSSDTKTRLQTAGFLEMNDQGEITQAFAPRGLGQMKEVGDILALSDDADDRNGAVGVHAVEGLLHSVNSDPETMRTNVAGAALIGMAARGYAEDEDIAAAGNVIAGDKSMEFAQRVIGVAEKTGAAQHPEAKFGHSTMIQNGRFVASSQDRERSLDTLASISNNDWAQAKAEAILARTPQLIDLATETKKDAAGHPVLDEEGHTVLTERAKGMQKTIIAQASTHANGPPKAKAAWNEIVNAASKDAAPGSSSLREQVDAYDRTTASGDPRVAGAPTPPPGPPDMGDSPT